MQKKIEEQMEVLVLDLEQAYGSNEPSLKEIAVKSCTALIGSVITIEQWTEIESLVSSILCL